MPDYRHPLFASVFAVRVTAPASFREQGPPAPRFFLFFVLPLLALVWLALLPVFPALAQEAAFSPWQAILTRHSSTPERLIAVDKSEQRLFLYERRSPPAQAKKFICTTGRARGDKSVEGDLKTPEGVYFIVQHIGSGLDFVKYGYEAYTLNYPNPVDRLRQKTGYGIWIHGRGEPLVPLQTEGCVAMINEDLTSLKDVLQPGTPVALTSSLSFDQSSSKKQAAVKALEKKVLDWAEAWASRSHTMFDFYDHGAYTVAQGEPFSRFQTQKERLFKMLPWIKTTVHNIQVLQGPGYWVTWFYQEYQAPNLTTKGVRRLYWMQDSKGDFKIVGMEWTPGMSTGTLLASAEPAVPPIETQPRTEEQDARDAKENTRQESASREAAPAATAAVEAAPADHVEDPSMGAMAEPLLASVLMAVNHSGSPIPSGDWAGTVAMPDRQMALPAPTPVLPLVRPALAHAQSEAGYAPSEDAGIDLLAAEDGRGRIRRSPARKTRQEIGAETPGNGTRAESAAGTRNATARGQNATLPQGNPQVPGMIAQALDEALQTAGSEAAQTGGEAPPAPDSAPAAQEKGQEPAAAASAQAATPPAVGEDAALAAQDAGQTDTSAPPEPAAPFVLSKRTIYSQPATDIFYPPETLAQKSDEAPQAAAGASEPEAAATAAAEAPAQPPHTTAAPPQEPPAGEEPVSTPEDAAANRLADTVKTVTILVEEWREAWEAGDIDTYMIFYAPKAVQGTRQSAKAIRAQKAQLWATVSPTKVALSDVRIVVKGKTVLADMRQEYEDSKGLSDTGIKTLTFENIQGAWRITREDWSPIPNEAGN